MNRDWLRRAYMLSSEASVMMGDRDIAEYDAPDIKDPEGDKALADWKRYGTEWISNGASKFSAALENLVQGLEESTELLEKMQEEAYKKMKEKMETPVFLTHPLVAHKVIGTDTVKPTRFQASFTFENVIISAAIKGRNYESGLLGKEWIKDFLYNKTSLRFSSPESPEEDVIFINASGGTFGVFDFCEIKEELESLKATLSLWLKEIEDTVEYVCAEESRGYISFFLNLREGPIRIANCEDLFLEEFMQGQTSLTARTSTTRYEVFHTGIMKDCITGETYLFEEDSFGRFLDDIKKFINK